MGIRSEAKQVDVLFAEVELAHAGLVTALEGFQTLREDNATKIAELMGHKVEDILAEMPAPPRPRKARQAAPELEHQEGAANGSAPPMAHAAEDPLPF